MEQSQLMEQSQQTISRSQLCALVHKAWSIKIWMSSVGKLVWPAQSPDISLKGHLLDELEQRL